MVNYSTDINKTKNSINSDGQLFHQYQQNKKQYKQWWEVIFCFDNIGGIVDHHCLDFLLFCWYRWNSWPSLFILFYVLLISVE
jgi:hypothetical protein